MRYALLWYDSDDIVGGGTTRQEEEVFAKHEAVEKELADQGRLGPNLSLMPTSAAITVRSGGEPIVMDGPFAETKEQIEQLYALLETLQPSPVVTLNRAVAVSKVHGPQKALALIEPLADRLSSFFNFHGVKGALLAQLGRADDARAALNRAIALARTPAEAAHIRLQLDQLLRDRES